VEDDLITEDAARAIATQHLADVITPRVGEALVVTAVHEYPTCWVVTYNTEKYADRGEIRHALAGNGPMIVNRSSGSIRMGVASQPFESQLDPD
jgi:hypothetical protein